MNAVIKLWDELTPKQKVARWQSAVRVIQNLSRHEQAKHFDMSTWGEKNDCGTIGCAAGFCGMDPSIRKQGLKLNFHKEGGSYWGSNMGPAQFYGHDAYQQIFINEKYTRDSGTEVYRKVRDHMKRYLKELVSEAKGSK